MNKRTKYEATLASIGAAMGDRIGDKDYRHGKMMVQEVKRLETAVTALAHIRISRNPSETEAAHYKRIAAAAKRLQAETASAQQRINSLQQQGVTEIENRITERLGLFENTFGPELRATLRAMDDTARTNAVRKIIESGDGASVAAITKVPAILTGLAEDMQSKFAEVYISKNAPDLVQERDALFNNIADCATSLGVAGNAADAYLDPARLAVIEADEQRAQSAQAGFDAAFAGQ